jgi:hypothetical protein
MFWQSDDMSSVGPDCSILNASITPRQSPVQQTAEKLQLTCISPQTQLIKGNQRYSAPAISGITSDILFPRRSKP